MVQTVAYFTGFETGDASEVVNIGTSSIQGTNVRSGAYSLKQTGSGTILVSTLSATKTVIRAWVKITSLPGSEQYLIAEVSTGTTRARLLIETDGTLKVDDASGTMGLSTTAGTHAIATSTWTMVEFAVDLAGGGVVKAWVNGIADISTTHSSNVSGAPTTEYDIVGMDNPNQFYFDDIRIDQGGTAAIGNGKTVARQGKAGTPTYDTWTKNGDTTAALCWSETPFATGKNCSSTTSAAAQTMLVEKFSITQSGHGSDVIGSGYTINACKTALIAKRSSSGSPSIRRRVGGADTDTAKTMTASDVYYDDGIWTTTTANLDSMEAGMVKAADTNSTTVEDVWVMVEYTPVLGKSSFVAIL